MAAGRTARAAAMLGAGLALIAATAQAAPKARAPAGGPYMTLEELRTCGEALGVIQKEEDRITDEGVRIRERQAREYAELNALQQAAAVIDFHKVAELDAANARVAAQRKRIEATNVEVDARNTARAALNTKRTVHNATCASRPYRLSDMAKLPPELQRALHVPDSPSVPDLTYEQVRACAERTVALDADSKRLAEIDGRLGERRTAMEAEGAAIEADGAKVNTRKKKEVEAFNARLAAHDKEIEAYNAEVVSMQTGISAHNTESLAFDAACARGGYRDEIVAKLPPELRSVVVRQLGGAEPAAN